MPLRGFWWTVFLADPDTCSVSQVQIQRPLAYIPGRKTHSVRFRTDSVEATPRAFIRGPGEGDRASPEAHYRSAAFSRRRTCRQSSVGAHGAFRVVGGDLQGGYAG